MNLAGKAPNDILFVDFNQDFSCVSISTRTGYKIFNCDPFGKCYNKSDGGIGIVEMLFCTSLVALVGAGEQAAFSPRRLQIINTKRQSLICELLFVNTVLAVKMNRKRLIVVLEEHIYIYDIGNMKLQHTIDTNPNPNALCALSPSSDNCYLAYPPNSAGATGELLILDAINSQAVNIIQAHKSPLSSVVFNYDGTMVATASDKGTVIRVFAVPGGQKLFQFRRGTYPARIYSLSFSLSNAMLCVSSDTDTVHIYKLADEGPKEPQHTSLSRRTSGERKYLTSVYDTLKSPLASATAAVGSYLLPDAITEMWDPQRDFAFAKLPTSSKGLPSLVALSGSSPQLMVVTGDGYFYSYNVDLENGGECILLKQYTLVSKGTI
ncbi:WD40-repeat-containing domain protein [Cladochytrium replicatum]|nr:WD40-repeat-containing domain protein [Cladochytrium replicatum]